MNQLERPIVIKHFVTEEQPFNMMQKAAMMEVGNMLTKFIKKAWAEGFYFTVTPFRDHVKGVMIYHGLRAYVLKPVVGVAKFKQAERIQQLGKDLHHYLQTAVQFNLIVEIESDTSQVYFRHVDRPIVIHFRSSTAIKPD
jgi:lipopolysaccharide biosynthesis glycosyltransferase